MIDKVKKILRFLRKSKPASSEFHGFQELFRLPKVVLKQVIFIEVTNKSYFKSTEVRWNSMFLMLKSFHENKQAIVAMLGDDLQVGEDVDTSDDDQTSYKSEAELDFSKSD